MFPNYPCIDDLKPGDVLVADNGFDCIDSGRRCVVKQDAHGLYVDCRGTDGKACTHSEKHYLDGQVDDEAGLVIGFVRATEDMP